MPDQVMQSLFGARDAARSRGDKMTAAFERMAAIKQEREQIAKQEAAQRLQFMEQTASQKSWWRDTDEPTRTAFFDQRDKLYETLGVPAPPRSDKRVEFLSADIDRIMKDANQGIGVVEDPKTGTVRLSPLVIAKLRDDYGDWADRQFVDMGNTLMAQTPQPPVTEAPGVDTSKAKTVQGKESLVMDAGAALPQTQHIGRLEDSLNEMLGHVMNSPERREKIAHDADLALGEIMQYITDRKGAVKQDDPFLTESVDAVNRMRGRIGLAPLPVQYFFDSTAPIVTPPLTEDQKAMQVAGRMELASKAAEFVGKQLNWKAPQVKQMTDQLIQHLGVGPQDGVTPDMLPQQATDPTGLSRYLPKTAQPSQAGETGEPLFIDKPMDPDDQRWILQYQAGREDEMFDRKVQLAKLDRDRANDAWNQKMDIMNFGLDQRREARLQRAENGLDTSDGTPIQKLSSAETNDAGKLGFSSEVMQFAPNVYRKLIAERDKPNSIYFKTVSSPNKTNNLTGMAKNVVLSDYGKAFVKRRSLEEAAVRSGANDPEVQIAVRLFDAADDGRTGTEVGPTLRSQLKSLGLKDSQIQSEYTRLMNLYFWPHHPSKKPKGK